MAWFPPRSESNASQRPSRRDCHSLDRLMALGHRLCPRNGQRIAVGNRQRPDVRVVGEAGIDENPAVTRDVDGVRLQPRCKPCRWPSGTQGAAELHPVDVAASIAVGDEEQASPVRHPDRAGVERGRVGQSLGPAAGGRDDPERARRDVADGVRGVDEGRVDEDEGEVRAVRGPGERVGLVDGGDPK